MLAGFAAAQTPNVIATVRHTTPLQVPVAPGEVTTLFVSGIGKDLSSVVSANAGMLPTSLAGISVTLRQAGRSTAVPIFQVRRLPACAPSGADPRCGALTAITVQIPYELEYSGPGPSNQAPAAWLTVSEAGAEGGALQVTPLLNHLHIVRECDLPGADASYAELGGGVPCRPVITHADGTKVSDQSPARPAETVIAYAFGLGPTDGSDRTGAPAARIANAAWVPVIDWNGSTVDSKPSRPQYAGVTPGFAGLYQINFTVPQIPAASTNDVARLTINISAGYSSDLVVIPVMP